MTDRQKFWLKVAVAVTFPLWVFPFLLWQIADAVIDDVLAPRNRR